MKKLKVGAVLYDPKVSVIWQMIEDYYKENGAEIEAVYFKDYDLQVTALENKEIDIAWNSPLARLDSHLRLAGKDKFGPMRNTDRDLCTYMVVRKDRGFKNVSDLKGKKIGFGAIDSPQARLIPIKFLRDNGLEFGKDYEEVRFDIGVGLHGDHVGGEKDAMYAMIDGKTEASFVLAPNFEAWLKDGSVDENVVEVLAKTEKFDHCLFSAHQDVCDEDLKEFSDIMLKMDYSNEKEKEIMDMEGLTKWVEGRTTGFEQITEANKYLNFLENFNEKR